jgi:hypothetical protein
VASGFGLDVDLGGGGEQSGEDVVEVNGGEELCVEDFGDLQAGAFGLDLFLKFEGVEITEIGLGK